MEQLQLKINEIFAQRENELKNGTSDHMIGRFDEYLLLKDLIQGEIEKHRLIEAAKANGSSCWNGALNAMVDSRIV